MTMQVTGWMAVQAPPLLIEGLDRAAPFRVRELHARADLRVQHVKDLLVQLGRAQRVGVTGDHRCRDVVLRDDVVRGAVLRDDVVRVAVLRGAVLRD
eukprot:6289573-Lingulodinium_polyedra.AAC.1